VPARGLCCSSAVVTPNLLEIGEISTPSETREIEASHSRITQEPVTLFGARGAKSQILTLLYRHSPGHCRFYHRVLGSVVVGETLDFHTGVSLELEHESSTPPIIGAYTHLIPLQSQYHKQQQPTQTTQHKSPLHSKSCHIYNPITIIFGRSVTEKVNKKLVRRYEMANVNFFLRRHLQPLLHNAPRKLPNSVK